MGRGDKPSLEEHSGNGGAYQLVIQLKLPSVKCSSPLFDRKPDLDRQFFGKRMCRM